jgi:hypothetical protein
MKKGKSRNAATMRSEYKRGDFPGALARGKYTSRLAAKSNIVRLKPKIAAAFPTSEAVNAALAAVLRKGKTERIVSRSGVRGREK